MRSTGGVRLEAISCSTKAVRSVLQCAVDLPKRLAASRIGLQATDPRRVAGPATWSGRGGFMVDVRAGGALTARRANPPRYRGGGFSRLGMANAARGAAPVATGLIRCRSGAQRPCKLLAAIGLWLRQLASRASLPARPKGGAEGMPATNLLHGGCGPFKQPVPGRRRCSGRRACCSGTQKLQTAECFL